MRLRIWALAGAAMIGATSAGEANAAIHSFTVTGTFSDGATLSGGFSLDDTGSIFDQFKNVNLTVDGFHTFDAVTGIGASPEEAIEPVSIQSAFGDIWSSGAIYLSFVAHHDGFIFKDIENQALTAPTFYSRDDVQNYLVSGTISKVTANAVPEPAEWAMLLVGFGGIGVAARRLKASLTVSYT